MDHNNLTHQFDLARTETPLVLILGGGSAGQAAAADTVIRPEWISRCISDWSLVIWTIFPLRTR